MNVSQHQNAWVRKPIIMPPQKNILISEQQWNWLWQSNRQLVEVCNEKVRWSANMEMQLKYSRGETSHAQRLNTKLQEENHWATQLLTSLRETVGGNAWQIAVDAHLQRHGLLAADCNAQRAVLVPRAVSPKPIKALLPQDAVIRSPVASKEVITACDGSPSSFEWINNCGFEQPMTIPPTIVEVTDEACF